MEAITIGMQGPAVEDVQTRLVNLGHDIARAELDERSLESRLRRRCALSARSRASPLWTMSTWSAGANSSDASYKLGDRTLYLRIPNFHGADVCVLQHALNALGFSCGEADGYLAPHTEAGLQQFQENVGLFADGMAFQDTFNYINRLHHIWKGKPSVSESDVHIGFARAASVLERNRIAVIGVDPIARNVASRMWNIATATTNSSGMQLCDREAPDDVDIVFEIASDPLPDDCAPRATIVLAECANVGQRIRTALAAATARPALLRIELTGLTRYGSFTASDAQALAVQLLDGVCDALSD